MTIPNNSCYNVTKINIIKIINKSESNKIQNSRMDQSTSSGLACLSPHVSCFCAMCMVKVFFCEYFLPHFSQANCGPVMHSYFSCLNLFLRYLYCFFLQIEHTYFLSVCCPSFNNISQFLLYFL